MWEGQYSNHVKKNCIFLVEFNNYLSLFDHCGIVTGFVFEPDSVSTIILVIFVSSICYCQLQRWKWMDASPLSICQWTCGHHQVADFFFSWWPWCGDSNWLYLYSCGSYEWPHPCTHSKEILQPFRLAVTKVIWALWVFTLFYEFSFGFDFY